MDFSRFTKLEEDEKVIIPRPEKAAKTEIYYFDKNDKKCEVEDAVKFIARGLDEEGNIINETFGNIKPLEETEKQKKL